jgi:hypothetical protein
VVGTLHVDAMLDGLTPRQFDELIASEELDPMFNPEVLYATMRLGFTAICRVLGADNVEPEMFDPRIDSGESSAASPEQAATAFRALVGGKGP